MRIVKLFIPLSILIANCAFAIQDNSGYSIKLKINGVKDTVSYLAYHYGGQQVLVDTARFNSSGQIIFDGKKKLPGGIYIVTLPHKKYFEMIIDKEQNFSMSTDTTEMVKNMKITGSVENKFFYDYLQFITRKQQESSRLKVRLAKNTGNKDSAAYFNKKIAAVDSDVRKYKADFSKKHPEMLLSKVFNIMRDPEIPKTPILSNGRPDSLFEFHFMQSHFFDGVDFTDERIVHTPVLQIKYIQYFENYVYHHPDSINKAADALVEKARANKELFKFTVHYVTSTYESSKIMGMDAVFVHMAEKYYMTHQAFWVDTLQLNKIVTRALKLKPTLLESQAPEIVMNDSAGKPISLLGVKAKYIAIFFWNYDCHHCQEAANKLIEVYKKYKTKGFEVYAVETETQLEPWKKYIAEHHFNWINVCDPTLQSNFRAWYDVYMTPLLLLVDEKKKIIAKQITVEQLEDLLSKRLN